MITFCKHPNFVKKVGGSIVPLIFPIERMLVLEMERLRIIHPGNLK